MCAHERAPLRTPGVPPVGPGDGVEQASASCLLRAQGTLISPLVLISLADGCSCWCRLLGVLEHSEQAGPGKGTPQWRTPGAYSMKPPEYLGRTTPEGPSASSVRPGGKADCTP